MKRTITLIILFLATLSLTAQTQSWQWIKAGGSSSDNSGISLNQAAGCKISGCDAWGNVYAVGDLNGPGINFDTFHRANTIGATYRDLLLFSYDCSGRMRWAKQISDEDGYPNGVKPGILTDIMGNTYLSVYFTARFKIGHTTIDSLLWPYKYIYLIKFDSLGRTVWVRNYGRDTSSNAYVNEYCQGIRLGSSGHLWMLMAMDSSYQFAPALRTGRVGRYQVEVDPANGNVLGGYYVSNYTASDEKDFDNMYDIDGSENYYQTGSLNTATGGIGDTLHLNGHTFSPDSSLGLSEPYIYSLDKHGNFRFLISNTAKGNGGASSCKYDLVNNRLISSLFLDSGAVIAHDTLRFRVMGYSGINGITNIPFLFCTDANGSELWHKGISATNTYVGINFRNLPTANFISNVVSNGFWVYNNRDTLNSGRGSCPFNCTNFYRQLMRIDKDGNLISSFTVPMGTANLNNGDYVTSGAIDWRGNLYMGGSITSYMALPNGDSVANTDPSSGNFFIAKIGISDCSCPTSGVQFTQVVHGDTVTYYGFATNRRDSIHWHLGDGTNITADTFTHIYAHGGSYTVTAISYNGCGIDSISRVVNVTTSIVETSILETRIYPNPAHSRIFVEVSGAARMGLVAVNGTSMWEQPKQVNQAGTYVFDMSSYANALYYFIVEYQNGKIDVMPVVKE